MANEKESSKKQPNGNASAGFAEKAVHKADSIQEKATKHNKGKQPDDKPAGGYSNTPIPQAPPGFTVKLTFHRASNLPAADINPLSSDPYIVA